MKQSFERQLPNLITGARIVVSPLLFILAAKALMDHDADAFRLSIALLAPIAFSDWLDGWLARRWGHVTKLGKWLDPAADKFLIYGLLAVLVRWMCLEFGVVILSPILIIIGLGLVMDLESQWINLSSGSGANNYGKHKFHLQLAAVTVGLMSGYFLTGKSYNFLVLVAVACLLIAAHRYAKKSLEEKYKAKNAAAATAAA